MSLNRPGGWYEELSDYYEMCDRLDKFVSCLLTTLEDEGPATADRRVHVGPRLSLPDATKGIQTNVPRIGSPSTDDPLQAGV